MCTKPGGQTVACLRVIWDEPFVQDHWREEGGRPVTHMRCPVCTKPGEHTVACLRDILDEPSDQDHWRAESGRAVQFI
jgi:hypothetical protein